MPWCCVENCRRWSEFEEGWFHSLKIINSVEKTSEELGLRVCSDSQSVFFFSKAVAFLF